MDYERGAIMKKKGARYSEKQISWLKNLLLGLIALSILIIAGCSGSSTGPDVRIIDTTSGDIYMYGKELTTVHLPNGETEEETTAYIDFVMTLKLLQVGEEKVRFYGLEGADVGKSGNYVFPGCTRSDDCPVYGRMTTNETFEININNQGRSYTATGSVRTVHVQLEGVYQSENVTIRYELNGRR
jgi:hypothetical protein